MSERSSGKGSLSESRGGWDRGRTRFREWTREGGANGGENRSVAADGDRTRYQRGAHERTCARRAGAYASTWVVPQDGSLVPKKGQGFFILVFQEGDDPHEALHEAMAENSAAAYLPDLDPYTQHG